MARDPSRRRVLVPFEVGSFLRAPYGWTSQQRARDGHPRGGRAVTPLGFWRNLGLGVAYYAPLVVGGVVGWRVSASWLGVVAGIVAAAAALSLVYALVAGPVLLVADRRRRGPRSDRP